MVKQKRLRIEQVVKLKTDPDSLPRMVTRYQVSKGATLYELTAGPATSWHFRFEIEEEIKTNKVQGFGTSGT